GLECKDEIYSSSQYSTVKPELDNSSIPAPKAVVVPDIVVSVVDDTNNNEVSDSKGDRKPISSTAKLFGNLKETEGLSRPQSVTSKIFGPRTKDMSRGFLTFSDEEPGLTMLKDEPEDLTHLAPVAGDVCVPLEDHPFISDMLDDILLRDNFSPLLTEEPSDPFIAYRDFQDTSPQLLSPNLSKQSDCSLPSLNSPSDSLIDDEMSTFMNIQMEDDAELVLKAPFIPMSISDDLPLLMSNDLMWSSNEKKQMPDSNSSLAQLLSNKRNFKATDHGGGLLQEQDSDDIYNKNCSKSWTEHNNNSKNLQLNKLDRTQSVKRPNSNIYDQSSKRTRNEPKEKMSSELLHQLISNNNNRGRPKGKNNSNWLLDNTGQKAACISQPSDSVLMNLLDSPVTNGLPQRLLMLGMPLDPIAQEEKIKNQLDHERNRRQLLRKNSISLLDPEATSLASLMDLTQQDYDVNAPVSSMLLQGQDLLTALEVNASTI
ncbi:hypothetical protein JTB14_024877, partial [Gonioctena quinquepunctata]